MFDFNFLPDDGAFIQKFTIPNTWYTWVKPKGCRYVFMIVAGGGGGGGTGFTAIAGSARGGGAGGGSGAITKIMIPAILLPDILYINVGSGGNSAGAGSPSYVSYYSTTNVSSLFCFARGGSVGANGAGSGTATGGAGGTATTIADAILMGLGNFVSNGGVAGGSGGVATGAAGGGGTALASNILMGGTGGAGTGTGNANNVGGNIAAAGLLPFLQGGVSAGENGRAGVVLWRPFCALGGTGGASNGAAGNGGNGGNGEIGCGGGGGGGAVTGGNGGKGGNGIVMIIAL